LKRLGRDAEPSALAEPAPSRVPSLALLSNGFRAQTAKEQQSQQATGHDDRDVTHRDGRRTCERGGLDPAPAILLKRGLPGSLKGVEILRAVPLLLVEGLPFFFGVRTVRLESLTALLLLVDERIPSLLLTLLK
jgi:hypothetical protein